MREVNGIDPGLNYKTKPNLRTPQAAAQSFIFSTLARLGLQL